MSTEVFMNAVVSKILAWRDTNFPTLRVVFENDPPFDESECSEWLDVEFRWYGATEVTVESRPVGRHSGALSCNMYVREGEGRQRAVQILDSLQEEMRSTRVGGGILRFGQKSVPTPMYEGWFRTGMFFPFLFDQF